MLPYTLLLLVLPQCLSSNLDKERHAFFKEVLSSSAHQSGFCKPSGMIQDACCDFETIEGVNRDLHRQLDSLVHTNYFKYWKVDLFRECPFWREDGSCMNRACAVEEVPEENSEIPIQWQSAALSEIERVNDSTSAPLEESEETCYYRDSDFCRVEDIQLPTSKSQSFYVDLTQNPERFTGYAGVSANKVWQAIYEENCFGSKNSYQEPSRDRASGGSGFAHLMPAQGGKSPWNGLLSSLAGPRDEGEEECLEKRVYYRLISGLHASISIHICDEYLDQSTGQWSPNLDCFVSRIGEHPERLQNVYFDYVVFLRALAKAAPKLAEYNVCTGDDKKDAETKQILKALLGTATSCAATFDETNLFNGPGSIQLKEEFKAHFRNVSQIMDCVGCDKCRLWGGLQVSGFGTALKLLFEAPDAGSTRNLDLTRSEVVAFINTLHRLSESLAAIEKFRQLWADRQAIDKQPKPLSKVLTESVSSVQTPVIKIQPSSPSNSVSKAIPSPRIVDMPPRRQRREPPVFPPQQKSRNVFIPSTQNESQVEAGAWLLKAVDACQRSLRRCIQFVSQRLGLSASFTHLTSRASVKEEL